MRERNRFKVIFSTFKVDPEDAREVVQVMCPKCKDTSSCKNLGADGAAECKNCKLPCMLVYQVQLLVKDYASQLNKNFYRVLLYSTEPSYGTDFFNGVKPCNLWHKDNADSLLRIQNYIRSMLRFNVWIEGILERKNQFFLLRDTKIRDEL